MSQVAQLPVAASKGEGFSPTELLITTSGDYKGGLSLKKGWSNVGLAFFPTDRGIQVAFAGDNRVSMKVGNRSQPRSCILCPVVHNDLITLSLRGDGKEESLKFMFVGFTPDKRAVRLLPS